MMKINTQSSSDTEQYFDGMEIGAVSVKWVRRSQNGEVVSEIIRHEGNPRQVVRELVNRHACGIRSRVAITGTAAKQLLDFPSRTESECIEKSLSFYRLKPDILVSLGGENFILYAIKDGRIKNIIQSSKCAAGTGEFIVQQFRRMNLSLHEGIELSGQGRLIELATRCSVYCKSDATHKLNKGECTVADVAKTLIHDLAQRVRKMIEDAQWPFRSVVMAGGLSLNQTLVEYLRTLLEGGEIIVPRESACLEAFGASLHASSPLPTAVTKSIPKSGEMQGIFSNTLSPLGDAVDQVDYRVETPKQGMIAGGNHILGIDAGSTTTKAALLNIETNTVEARCYLRTYGNPVQATRNCVRELLKQAGEIPIRIAHVATTGSGRELVSVYLDNCLSFNEILAHARAAFERNHHVDTVIEIGGQDSKYISFQKGIPVDYAMNEGCSAGTGSFLEESVSCDMSIAVDDIQGRALNSRTPLAFGERCAAFINTDLRNALQQGAAPDDVVAGLVYSIVKNYVSRIIGVRRVGETVLFQGGVALNKAVAHALAAELGKKIIVPPHPELMGCIGACYMALDRLKRGEIVDKDYTLERFLDGVMEQRGSFSCKACENRCEIQRIEVRKQVYPFGGLCSRYEIKRHEERVVTFGRNLIEERNRLMFEDYAPEPVRNARGAIGLPLALTTFELFPLYSMLINQLGFNLVLSRPSKEGNAKALTSTCYPCEIVHGAVYDLLSQGVDFILLPHAVEWEIPDGSLHSYACPSTAVIPGLIKSVFPDSAGKLLAPYIGLSRHLAGTTIKSLEALGRQLGIQAVTAREAGRKALRHQERFFRDYKQIGKDRLARLIQSPSVIIAGRPYITCSPHADFSLPRKIASRGYNVIPADMLSPLGDTVHVRDVWHYSQQISNCIAYVRKHRNLHACFVSCFSCSPDAVVYNFVRQELDGHAFCYLEVDSHTAHAGLETRIGAFLDIIQERQRSHSAAQGSDMNPLPSPVNFA